ncbi:urease subunit beta [Salicibibacter cibi]|uniref:Urease subunit beta n=1 Tax=Salicibibacter cibi TaxID=2743001 RepID=A0A7T6ZCV7_9BACI|nr:urease subunit beta [Salicibibacter cibi]QQK81163.1 urease subunit beta [Salicibibacter cibi]
MKPGAFDIRKGWIEINAGRESIDLAIKNEGTRSIQIGSHFHMAEANPGLTFDREKAMGMRLNIPSGTAVRFEPGEEQTVTLVSFGGKQQVYGFNNKTNAYMDERGKQKTKNKIEAWQQEVKKDEVRS